MAIDEDINKDGNLDNLIDTKKDRKRDSNRYIATELNKDIFVEMGDIVRVLGDSNLKVALDAIAIYRNGW